MSIQYVTDENTPIPVKFLVYNPETVKKKESPRSKNKEQQQQQPAERTS